MALKIKYLTANSIPVDMKNQLRAAKTANEAGIIFDWWENRGGFVSAEIRGTVYFEAGL